MIITAGIANASAAWSKPVSLPKAAFALLIIPSEALKSVLPFKFNTLGLSISILSHMESFPDPIITIDLFVSFNNVEKTFL